MDHLTDLFKLVELTRSQPQYGYALSGIRQDEMSNLAEHHYLVTFIAWQLAEHAKRAGAKVDVEKVLEFSMIHDLGELFGSDIAMPYAKANPKAKELAKAFEAENHRFLAKFFGGEQEHFQALAAEILDAKSDEALISKIADYMEVTHYKFYMRLCSQADMDLIEPKMQGMVAKLQDPVAKAEIARFVAGWIKDLPKKEVAEVLYGEAEGK